MSSIQLYKIIVRCEQRDDPCRPSTHHVMGSLKNNNVVYVTSKGSDQPAQTRRLIGAFASRLNIL